MHHETITELRLGQLPGAGSLRDSDAPISSRADRAGSLVHEG